MDELRLKLLRIQWYGTELTCKTCQDRAVVRKRDITWPLGVQVCVSFASALHPRRRPRYANKSINEQDPSVLVCLSAYVFMMRMATSSVPKALKTLGRSSPGDGASELKLISRDSGGEPTHPHLSVQIHASSFPGLFAGF